MPLDLGTYASLHPQSGDVASPNWGDLVSPSAMAGVSYLLRSSNTLGVLGISAAAAPSGTTTGRVPLVSLVLGAYVPFFDFN